MADPLDWYRSALGGDVGTGIPLNPDRTPVPDTGQGTAWSHLQQAPGDILTAALGLLERSQLGGLNALGLRSPGSDIYRAQIPVEPGLRAAEGAATFATGGLASSLFPAAGALRAGAQYAVPPGTMSGLLADEMGGIRAFHGSPHDFDRFDLSKIGTGEGAQAYGHGLYFAENEGVARGYKNALSGGVSYTGPSVDDDVRFSIPVSNIIKRLSETGETPEQAVAAVKSMMNDVAGMYEKALSNPNTSSFAKQASEHALGNYKSSLEIYDKISPTDFTRPGHMYEVDINADPKAFLDWDKPLSAQSGDVQRALRPGYGDITMRHVGENPNLGVLYDLMVDRQSIGTFPTSAFMNSDLTKKDLVQLAMAHDPRTGQSLYNNPIQYYSTRVDANSPWQPSGVSNYQDALAQVGGDKSRVLRINDRDPVVMSERLKEAGIPGIRYLDQGSRGAGQGSSNYAVFDDSLVQILRKYGLLPPVAGAGLMGGDNQ